MMSRAMLQYNINQILSVRIVEYMGNSGIFLLHVQMIMTNTPLLTNFRRKTIKNS